MDNAHATPSARFKASSNTLVKSFDDHVALVHMKTRRIHVLNSTATRLWKFVCAGNSRDEMRNLMLEEFSIDEQELCIEIDKLLAMLEQEGLIQILE